MLQHLLSHPILLPLLPLALFLLYRLTLSLHTHILIRRLGAHAPRAHGLLPLNIDIVIRSLLHCRHDTDLAFWHWLFSWSAPRGGHKTIEVPIGGQRFIFTAEPENIKAVLATQFAAYGKGKPFREDWREFLGESIFTTDGAAWHASRQLIRPQFVKGRVADLEVFERHVGKLVGLMGGGGEEVDISALFYRFTLDAATDYLLGHSVDSLDNPQAEFAGAFAEVQRVQNLISRVGPFNRFIPRRSFRAGLKVINSFVEPYIEEVLRLDIAALKEKTNQSFLHALAATGTRDRKVIRDQVVAVLLAGRDTTAGTLSFLFQELSQHPEIVAKLRAEILETVGPREAPTYDDLKGMSYLQHAMSEVLRLYPSVPFNVRLALQDTTLPTGGGADGLQPIGILKDTPIAYSTLLMQRREDLYPPESPDFPPVATFSPERWEKWQPKSWQYIPFNGGPRICIGQQFALTEMAYTIVRILQRFDRIDKHWKHDGSPFKSDIVLSPAQGVQVGFWEAKRD